MRLSLILLCTLFVTNARATTLHQLQEQQADEGNEFYQKKVKQRQESTQQLKERQNRQINGGGNVCAVNSDCEPLQFCRVVNGKASGICVEKQN